MVYSAHGFAVTQESRGIGLHCWCGNLTQNKKPWCSEHVRDSPYVQDLMERIKNYTPDADLLLLLERRGPTSIERAAQELGTSSSAIRAAAKRMKLRLTPNVKGTSFIHVERR